jgi:hypothetical protein
MDLKISHELLCRRIFDLAASSNEFRQVARRLEKVLPQRLREIEFTFRRRNGAGRAKRLALADKSYEAYIDQYCGVAADAHRDRILWETHCQLAEARQTNRAFLAPRF